MTQTHELEALLEGDDWLMGFARSLVRDPEDARDLVQDAYVAALERGKEARSLGPWLAGFVRLGAWSRRRRARMEMDHAVEVRREGVAEDAAAPVELAELRQVIGALVLELPEPRRSAVHLAHIAQLPLAEVAERLGVKKPTASHHVKRGLEDLRRKLDRQYGGDRRRWAAPLAAAAGSLRSKGAAGLAGGGVWLIGALGAAAAVALAVLLSRTHAPAVTGQPEVTARAAVSSPDLATTKTSPAESADPRSAAIVMPPPPAGRLQAGDASLSLALLDADGNPLAGAPWSLTAQPIRHRLRHEFERALGIPDAFEEQTGVTGADGLIHVSFPGHRALDYRIGIRGPGHLPHDTSFSAARAEAVDLGTVILERGVTLTGRLVDGEGAPVLGVAATLVARQAGRRRSRGRAGIASLDPATGTFALAVPASARYVIEVFHAGAPSGRPLASADVAVENDEPDDLRIEVDVAALRAIEIIWTCSPRRSVVGYPASALEGVTATGSSGESLELEHRGGIVTTLADPGEGTATLAVNDPRFAAVEIEGLNAGTSRFVELTGSACVIWRENGAPLEDVQIILQVPGRGASERVIHDGRSPLAEGRLEGLVPGTYEMRLRRGTSEAWGTIEALRPGEERVVDVTLEPARTVSGRVAAASGAPVAGAVVGLCSTTEEDGAVGDEPIMVTPKGGSVAGYGFIERKEIALTVTDEGGRFALDLPEEGVHMLLADPPGGGRVWSERLEAGTEDVGVVLATQTPALVTGMIQIPDDVDPGALSIEFESRGDEDFPRFPLERIASIDDLGRILPVTLAPGSYNVKLRDRVLGRGGRPSGVPRQRLAQITLAAGDARVLSLTMSDEDHARVRVQTGDPAGMSPCLQAAVVPVREGAPRWRGAAWLPVEPDGTAGPFRVPPGNVKIFMAGADWIDAGRPPLTVEGSGDLLLTADAEVIERRIRVFVDGEPACARQVSVRGLSAASASLPVFRTDDDGYVTLRLAPGVTTLRAPRQGEVPEEVRCTWPVDEVRF